MGRRAAEALRLAGHAVTVLGRSGRAPEGAEPLVADRHDPAALERALRGRRFELAVDFVAFDGPDVAALTPLADAFDRYALISSGQVYLVTERPTPPFREGDEDAPLMREPAPGTPDHGEWSYGMGKRRAEAALDRLAARGVAALALRLPVVQGEDDPSLRLWGWLERMLDGGPVPLPDGGTRRVRFVYAGDVGRAAVRLVEGPWPRERALNLAQPDDLSLASFLSRVADAAGVAPRFVAFARPAMEAAGLDPTALPYVGRWSSVPDPTRALEELGFPATALDEWLPRVVRAHLDRRPPSHPGYAQRKRERAWLESLAAGATSR